MIYNIFLLLCALISMSYGSNVPVLIWGTASDPAPALELVTSQKLTEQINPKLHDSLLLVIVEKKLSSQDFSECKSDSEPNCYSHLSNFTHLPHTYYLNVENPVEALRSIGEKREYVVVDSKGDLNNPISYKAGKVVFVSFEDDESANRNEKLRNHDNVISKLWQELSLEGKVIAVYTGLESNALQRTARQAKQIKEDTTPNPKHFMIKQKFLIYYESFEYVSGKDTTPLTFTSNDLKETEPKLYDVELANDKTNDKITFQIKFDGGYWSIENLKYKDEAYRISPEIAVPTGFSYYCGGTSNYHGPQGALVIKGLQAEAYTTKMEKNIFGDAWHCVGFTSPGIWGGLFVTFMLLGIMTIGILWLMDVKTMDRFDDPKGKTITINATD